MHSLLHSFVRITAFIGKEIAEVVRQPRLILTLVLGPFLILFIFGLGYKNEPRPVRMLFVADPKSALYTDIKEYASTISPELVYSGVTGDKNAALQQLHQNQVDVVAVAPDNAYETIQNNQQAIFTLYHNEIDPSQSSYIDYLGQVYVDEVNRRVLIAMAQQGQSQASDVDKDIKEARANASALKQALQGGDTIGAAQYQQNLTNNVDALALALGASAGLLSGVEKNVGSGSTTNSDILNILAEVQKNTSPNSSGSANPSSSDQIARLDKADADLAKMDEQLTSFKSISPEILVRPFGVNTKSVAQQEITAVAFFTPSVIVLLLQHIAVTIAALSIVRERRSGTLELFRVSPISAMETMIGKYISYFLFGGVIAAILTALIFYGLHIPMLGSWQQYALVAAVLIFTSLGLGFVISLIAQTESQAVQLAMIALLLSVFFSGFILDLRYFYEPVRVISYAMPATYGIILLQNIMLRGLPAIPLIIGGLAGIGIFLFLVAWLLMRRLMATR